MKLLSTCFCCFSCTNSTVHILLLIQFAKKRDGGSATDGVSRAAFNKICLEYFEEGMRKPAEDDLLVQAVVKHSTSDAIFRDWSEVAWELPGRSEQQCKERYSLADTVILWCN